MNTVRMGSDEARIAWGDLINEAIRDRQIIITRYNKPVAVLISHERWQELTRNQEQRRTPNDR